MTEPCVTISVITPSFNQGEFLAETIESVIGQSGAFFIDYVIVDGGSTDRSVQLIADYQRLLRRGGRPIACRGISFRWLSERDRGQSDALMKGFALARGEILCWLNSDDCYLPGALQAAADCFLAHPETALCYGKAEYCDREGALLGSYRTGDFDLERLAWFNFICQPSAFFRREAFDAVGGVDRELHYAMDYDLWVRIGKRFPCRHLPRTMSRYRLHEGSKTVRDETLLQNSEEALRLAMKHYGWAPLTRIYNSCSLSCRSRLPGILARSGVTLIAATLLCSLARSLWLNRGVRRKDLALLNRENFAKLFRSRIEIMTGAGRG